mmetsp:Transcript_19686/g.29211  ORF Transcript_19686/g.29211 Transcript_19686/m.29211 type:complete len:279 (+) Transcript_19686:229-1065(+)
MIFRILLQKFSSARARVVSRQRSCLHAQVDSCQHSYLPLEEIHGVDVHARALSAATKLQQRALHLYTTQGDEREALACFSLAMEICKRYASKVPDDSNLLPLASSSTHVGLTILENESLFSDSYDQMALKCLSFSLNILRNCYEKQKICDSTATKGKIISVLDLATASCHVARAHLKIKDTTAALQHARYALRAIVADGRSIFPTIDLDDLKCQKVISYCCFTKAVIFAKRMQYLGSNDKSKSLKYYNLAIGIQKQRRLNQYLATCTSSFYDEAHQLV